MLTGLSLAGYLLFNVQMARRTNSWRAEIQADIAIRARSDVTTRPPTAIHPVVPPEPSKALTVNAPSFTWDEFWAWAKPYHFASLDDVAYWLDTPVNGLSPLQVRKLIEIAAADRTVKYPARALTPPISPAPLTILRREVIPSENASTALPKPDMIYDDDEDWADSLVDEDNDLDEAGLPPLDSYNDAQVQRLREILQGQLQNYMRAYQQGFFEDAEIHKQWLDNRPELAKYLTWYHSGKSADARRLTRDDGDLLLEHYLFNQWI